MMCSSTEFYMRQQVRRHGYSSAIACRWLTSGCSDSRKLANREHTCCRSAHTGRKYRYECKGQDCVAISALGFSLRKLRSMDKRLPAEWSIAITGNKNRGAPPGDTPISV